MVRILSKEVLVEDVPLMEYSGLSTDDKPVGNIATGSVFIEADTGDAYFYDEENAVWNKVGG